MHSLTLIFSFNFFNFNFFLNTTRFYKFKNFTMRGKKKSKLRMTFPNQFILDWRRQTQEKWSNLIYLRTPSNWCHLAHTRCSINLWWRGPQKEWSPLVHPAPFTIELSKCPSNRCTSNLYMYIVQGSLDCIRVPSDFSSANFFCLMPQHSLPFTSHSLVPVVFQRPQASMLYLQYCRLDHPYSSNHTGDFYSNIPLWHHFSRKSFLIFPISSPPISTTWVDSILHLWNGKHLLTL